MKDMSALAAMIIALSNTSVSSPGQYTPWSQPPKGPRTKLGNGLTAARKKAKARRKAKQQARRSA